MICNTANLLLSLANMCVPFVSHLFFFYTKRKIQKQSSKVVFEKSYFWRFRNIHREHTCRSLFLIKLQVFSIKKRLQHKCFPVNIAKLSMTPIMKNICFKRLLLEIFSTISFSKEGQRIHECVTLQVRWHKYFCSSISNFIYNSRQILFFGGDDLDSSCRNTKLESELILKVCVCITFLSLIHLEQKIRSKFVHRLVCTNQFVARGDLLVFLGILYILPKN